jgi:hypothetical protein
VPGSGIQVHIDDVSRRMEEWLRGSVSGADIAFVSHLDNPAARAGADSGDALPRIEICFRTISSEKPDRALLNRDDTYALNYLLRVTGADALANQRILSEIFFAAHENDDFRIATSGISNGMPENRAGGPAVLSLIARLVRPAEAAAPGIVTEPLHLKLRSLGRIAGKVVTATGTPVMHAEIDARALNKRAVSDAAGQFTIHGAPAAGSVSLTVRARNRTVDVSVDAEKQAEIVIVIPKENEHA